MIKLYYTFSNPDSDAFIKTVLKDYTGKEITEIKRTQNTKPYAEGAEFSLSHTRGLTVCAVSEFPVGVDAEKVRSINNKEKIIARFIKEAPKNLSDEEFFRKWTAFESKIKLFGEAISNCPSVFEKELYTQTFELEGYIISVSSEKNIQIIKERI